MGDLRHRIQLLRKPLLLLLQLLSSLISVIWFLRVQLCFILVKLKCQVFYNEISCPALQSTSFKQTSNRRGAKEKEGNGNSGAEKGGDMLTSSAWHVCHWICAYKIWQNRTRTLTLCLHEPPHNIDKQHLWNQFLPLKQFPPFKSDFIPLLGGGRVPKSHRNCKWSFLPYPNPASTAGTAWWQWLLDVQISKSSIRRYVTEEQLCKILTGKNFEFCMVTYKSYCREKLWTEGEVMKLHRQSESWKKRDQLQLMKQLMKCS